MGTVRTWRRGYGGAWSADDRDPGLTHIGYERMSRPREGLGRGDSDPVGSGTSNQSRDPDYLARHEAYFRVG